MPGAGRGACAVRSLSNKFAPPMTASQVRAWTQPIRMPPLALLLCLCAALTGSAGGAALVASGGGDVVLAGCSRDRPCLNFGNCELHTGACACPIGYGGVLCEKALLSACALTRTPPAGRPVAMLCNHFWGSVGVTSCDCLRQCMAHMPASLASHGLCFERPGGLEAQTSDFPEADEAGVVYRRSSSPRVNDTMSRDDYLLHQHTVQRLKARDCGCALPAAVLTCACSLTRSASARTAATGRAHASKTLRRSASAASASRARRVSSRTAPLASTSAAGTAPALVAFARARWCGFERGASLRTF